MHENNIITFSDLMKCVLHHMKFHLIVFDCCQARRGLPVGFLCSGIQFYVLLCPSLCFISFLYLDLYFLGDAA